ncbi:MAG: hypothetical protein Q7T00_01035 [Rugosibacter sp.]|jgi:hypothetical protein|nr:hypothetical protein [Rugosibacter sp.]MDO9273799.1 hypothetical protein [Rugosibacter sp.]
MTKAQRVIVLFFLIGLFLAIGPYAFYAWWKPAAPINKGELLETRSAGLQLLALDGVIPTKMLAESVKKKWVFLTVQTASCDARCQKKLYLMRQIRTAQGENMDRIERVWVILGDGQPALQLLKLHPGIHLARVSNLASLAQLPLGTDPGACIFVIDPLGNLVMRYDDQSAPKDILKDMRRLLRFSGIG